MKKFSGEKMIIVAVTAAFFVLIGASVWQVTDADELGESSVTASPTENTQYDDSIESSSYDEDETEDFYTSKSTSAPINYSYNNSAAKYSSKTNQSTGHRSEMYDYDNADDYADDYAEDYAIDEFGDVDNEEVYDYAYDEAYDDWEDEMDD